MRGGKGKDTNDDFSANSMPNLEIFKGIDTNKDGEIDDDEFEAQRELFDFLGRMPNLDEDDEELDEKEIVDRLVYFNDSDKCSKEDGQCSASKEDEIIEEGLEDNEADSLDKKTEL
uniref:EF-hand domain-containing protein n=1 Tax=Meloidogyne javanica TaxID=6303 RepID=A0A915LNK7_MELJA